MIFHFFNNSPLKDSKMILVDAPMVQKADPEELDIIMIMDEFARTLYEEHKAFSAQAA